MTEHSDPLVSPVASSDSAEFARYVGDGVYVKRTPSHVVLTTSNGSETTNTIYLEAEVVRALRAWFRHVIDHERGDAE
jgi:hypothetical protein